ncbi:MAG: hypothetical protein MJY82_10715 [Fibrobacter sp.]|nr:hypothetical protein [Fibrobacter sp.]
MAIFIMLGCLLMHLLWSDIKELKAENELLKAENVKLKTLNRNVEEDA